MSWEILARFFKGMLKFLGIMDIVKNTKFLTVTVETLDDIQVENLQKACRSLDSQTISSAFWTTRKAFTIMSLPRRWRHGTAA